MDEEQNNNEQNLGEQINNGIQDTKNAVKDGANLGKNVATGNVLGAVKDGFKLLGNKTARKTILIAVLIPIIVIIALASSIYVIFDGIGSKVQDVISNIENLFIVDWDNGNGAISITNEAIDEIITVIESTGIDLADLRLMGDVENNAIDKESEEYKEILRKYIRKFYEAQVVTETLNTNPGWFEEYVVNGGKIYGSVYVYRASATSANETVNSKNSEQLKYMAYEKMQNYATAGNVNAIKKYFSVKDNKLVIPEWTETSINNGKKTYNVILREIDYKVLISQYTTPMNFFIYLAMVSQNPEFVSAVTDLVKGSKIDLTIFDTTTTTIEDTTYTYTVNTKGSKVSYESTGEVIEGEYVKEKVVTPINNKSERNHNVTTTITTVVPTLKVTYAKTWFCEQEITYISKELEPYNDTYDITANEDSSLEDDEEPDEPDEGETVSWTTDRKKHIEINSTGTTYEESVRGQVIDKSDNFIKLLDTKYKIPNSQRYEAAGINNLKSGAEMLFSLLQKDSNLQNLEQVMRYILGKYANKDYGVSSIDFLNIFDTKDFLTATTSGIKVKINEEGALSPLNRQQLQQIINKRFSGKARDNLLNSLDSFINIQNKYNVNAVFAIAVVQKESSCGTNWDAIDSSTYNWYSIKGEYNGNSYNGWKKYPSFTVAVEDFGKLIGTSSNYFAGGNITINSIATSYCPPGGEWAKSVSQYVKEMYESIGVTVSGTDGNEIQQKVVEVAKNSVAYGIVPKLGYCQGWVATVYNKANATTVLQSADCAIHAGQKWGVSTDWSQIQIGATVYGYSNSTYGHVGIYIGDGMVAHNIGRVAIDDLDQWIRKYNGVCWGWNGVDLTGGSYPFKFGLITPKH